MKRTRQLDFAKFLFSRFPLTLYHRHLSQEKTVSEDRKDEAGEERVFQIAFSKREIQSGRQDPDKGRHHQKGHPEIDHELRLKLSRQELPDVCQPEMKQIGPRQTVMKFRTSGRPPMPHNRRDKKGGGQEHAD